MDIITYVPIVAIFALMLGLPIYKVLLHRFYNVLYLNVMQKLGFKYSTDHTDFISHFSLHIGHLQVQTRMVFSGMFKDNKSWATMFTVIDNDENPISYIGLILETEQVHESLHIYDKRTVPVLDLKNYHESESIEFDKAFKIISPENKNFFYKFSPSDMVNLLKIRNEFKYPLNIQFYQNKVFIFSTAESLDTPRQDLTKIAQIISQTPDEKDVQFLADQIQREFETYYNFYKATKL